ncbi:hypothetical protein [Trinickia sp.]|uniref:hypothetical protein n=1 Tax=Trinickia sp. TaxID=2571163 RepID=UPI003F81BC87
MISHRSPSSRLVRDFSSVGFSGYDTWSYPWFSPFFGRKRIEDTEAEFKSQCPQISEVLSAFSRQIDIYSTDELLRTINNRAMAANPTIVGIIGKPTDLDIAHFLFEIGFIAGRRDFKLMLNVIEVYLLGLLPGSRSACGLAQLH